MADWLAHVQKPKNDAEVELVAAVLDALQAPVPEVVSRDPCLTLAKTAAAPLAICCIGVRRPVSSYQVEEDRRWAEVDL